ncbi:CvpA family protein [Aureibacillus halotolerans]|uniref:Putative membrane protein required for colicin V production n=1 Tax=Aureibacillus halotolerans TaxID=1508390 RepID=A0A4R6U346_9BACI|nr:CvpA family protein [Aureibacillus halotolerans]TDQ39173.1 putative membrane protein required for colicin V production [Aureibacillus halotolerans]
MLNLVLLLILFIGIMVGLRRGLILQVVHLAGLVLSFVVAFMYYKELGEKITLWVPYSGAEEGAFSLFENAPFLEQAFYNGVAFAILFFVTKVILQILGTMLDFLADLPILHGINRILGAVFGFVEVYLIVFVLLYVGALLPVEQVQEAIDHSSIAKNIIEQTPILSQQIKDLWFAHMEQ